MPVPETLASVERKTGEYALAQHEQELIVAYYNRHLYPGRTTIDAGHIIRIGASARNVASMWADLDDEESARIPLDVNSPISRAARLMYLASELLTDSELRGHWSREAAIAFLQGGNLSASRNAWLRYKRFAGGDVQSGDLMLAAMLPDGSQLAHGLPEGMTKPWLCITPNMVHRTQEQLFQYAYSNSPNASNDPALGYRISHALPLLGSLSLVGVCARLAIELPEWYYSALERAARLILMPSQRTALDRFLAGLDGNGVVCTPTSSGKTFVAESIGVITLNSVANGIVIYVAPYQAIAYAVHRTLSRRLNSSGIAVVAAYGDTTENHSSLVENKVVLVCTPERLDPLLLSQPEVIERTHVIVFDELHLISQTGRGAFYESIIGRVLFEQSTRGWPRRVLGLSAVVSNVDSLGEWMHAANDRRVISRWRPNPLIVGYWNEADTLFVRTDPDATTFSTFQQFCPEMPSWPSPYTNALGLAKKLLKPLGERCAWYATRWSAASEGPVLVICSSRKQTREFAVIAALQRTAASQVPAEISDLLAFLKTSHPELSLLSHCLARGIAYHNASLPTSVRRRLEQLFDGAHVDVVYATTTLAEGADFPFRAVVIASPSHYDFETGEQTAMSPLLMRNIAGRGGRSSGQLIGDVVQMYSPVQMTSVTGSAIQSHEVFLQHLLDPAASVVRSALLHGTVSRRESLAKSHFFASLDRILYRWPGTEAVIASYRREMFAPEIRNGLGSELEREYVDNMTATSVFGEPLAVTNSPLTLTALGVLVMRTGYGVVSASKVWRFIESAGWFTREPTGEEIVAMCASLGGVMPEVSELKSNKQRPLKDGNLWSVIQALISGRSLTEAYLVAENTSSSATANKARALVNGSAPNDSTAHQRLETFVEDIKRKVNVEMPLLIRTMKGFIRYRRPESDVTQFDTLLEGLEAVRQRIE